MGDVGVVVLGGVVGDGCGVVLVLLGVFVVLLVDGVVFFLFGNFIV